MDRRWLWAWLAMLVVVVVVAAGLAMVVRNSRQSAVSPTAMPTAEAPIVAPATAAPATSTDPSGSPFSPDASPSGDAGSGSGGSGSGGSGSGDRTSLAAFTRHVSAAYEEGSVLLATLQAAAERVDIPAVGAASDDIAAWAADETRWLERHPPQRCYRSVHRQYASAIDDFGQAARILSRFTDDFPFADFDDVQRALDLAARGSASMQSAADALRQTTC